MAADRILHDGVRSTIRVGSGLPNLSVVQNSRLNETGYKHGALPSFIGHTARAIKKPRRVRAGVSLLLDRGLGGLLDLDESLFRVPHEIGPPASA